MLSKQKINQIDKKSDFNLLLKKILDLSQEVLPSEGATLFLVDYETDELVFQIVNGPKSDELEGKRINMGKGIVGKAATTGKVQIENNPESSGEHEDKFDKETGFRTDSLLAAPLIVKGETTGVIELVNSKLGGYTEESKVIIRKLASQISSVLEIALLSERLKRSEEFLNVIINTLGSGVLIIGENNRIKRFNDRAKKILQKEKLKELKLKEVFKSKKLLEKLNKSDKKDEFVSVVKRNGENVHLQFQKSTAIKMNTSGIKKEYMILLINDITERLELSKVKFNKRLNASCWSEIAHNLKTPLTSILGLSNLLSMNDSLPENVSNSVQNIYKESLRMQEMVDKLVKLTPMYSGESMELKSVNLTSLISELVDEFDYKNIKLEIKNDEHAIEGNYRWLYNAFKELFKMGINAKGKEIKIWIEEGKETKDLHIKGMNKLMPKLSSFKNENLLNKEKLLKSKASLENLTLSLIRLILFEHRTIIKLNQKENTIIFRFVTEPE